MPKEAVFTMKLESDLRADFVAEAEAARRPASQVLRELMRDFIQRQRERKLVQWELPYIAATFALIQVLDVIAQRFGWPEQIERLLIVAMAVGFFVTLASSRSAKRSDC